MSHEFNTVPGDQKNVETKHVDFGFKDDRGRNVGYLVTTSEIDFVPATDDVTYTHNRAPGHYFVVGFQYAANQKPYGISALTKFFSSPSLREFAILKAIEVAKDRAFDKTLEGSARLAERRQARSAKPKLSTKEADKVARREAAESEAASKIAAIEADVQRYLDDEGLMSYLAAHSWPLVIPGPPSMEFTAHDRIVRQGLWNIEYSAKLKPAERPKAAQLRDLKDMLRLLKEQAGRFAKGLTPDSPSDRRLLGL